MAVRYVVCPLCGFEFERVDTLCVHGCPMASHCNLIRCPSCAYEFPEKPKAITWLGKLLKRELPQEDQCGQYRTVAEMAAGETSEVVSLGLKSTRRNTLSAFGLIEGAEITVIQQRPACVVRVGETELAIDREIAREILVLRDGEDAPPQEERGREAEDEAGAGGGSGPQ
jgi:Fe2+ transport system protein FeoA